MQEHKPMEAAWSQALHEGDLDGLLELYHPHALLETPFGRFHGRSDIEAAMASLPWHKLRDHAVVATRRMEDRIAMMTYHAGWTVEHTMQLVDGTIRAHRITAVCT